MSPEGRGRANRSVAPQVAVLDYGMGNLRSVEKAFQRVGAAVEITSDHKRIRAADGVVLPGVGAFPEAMTAVRARGLDELLRERVAAAVPIIGICLGMQLLFESSAEHGGAAGIGVFDGPVVRIDADGLKLPQIGWNDVTWSRRAAIADGLPDPCALYHVHSFAPAPARSDDVVGVAAYGSEFVTAVARGGTWGVQFHPEKSGAHGLRLLANFTATCA